MASPLTAAKQQLRVLMKHRLSSVSNESILAQSRQIFETLTNFKPYKDAARISIYLSMPTGEIQTDAIVRHALESGKQVFIPYLHHSPMPSPDTPPRVMDMVHLKNLQDYENLQRDRWGIPSVDPSSIHERQRILGGPDVHKSDLSALDLILMPGVAFDSDEEGSIRRLGHGRGFYDFFINRYQNEEPKESSQGPLLLYGLALSEQLVSGSAGEAVPTGPYDRKLDGLVLGTGEVKESPSRGLNT